MRVISGCRRGRKLKPPCGGNTRPTTDRVKENIFNIIQAQFPCECVLDLFAGSGALGIEALSRGAEHAVFIEKTEAGLKLVKENVESCDFLKNSEFYKTDALAYISACNKKFDVIFLDPPYNKGLLLPVIIKISQRNLLKEHGVIVIESEADGEEVLSDIFAVMKSAKYGKTIITVLRE